MTMKNYENGDMDPSHINYYVRHVQLTATCSNLLMEPFMVVLHHQFHHKLE